LCTQSVSARGHDNGRIFFGNEKAIFKIKRVEEELERDTGNGDSLMRNLYNSESLKTRMFKIGNL